MLIDRFEPFFETLSSTLLAPWVPALRVPSAARLRQDAHGDLSDWLAALDALPPIAPSRIRLDCDCVTVGDPLPEDRQALLRAQLDRLHPWRKGPFCVHGVEIDAEWRSDRKWQRLVHGGVMLQDRLVLDVGCGNGYYGYRALGAGARLVLGIDPTLRFVLQFLAIDHFLRDPRLAVLPLADVDLPPQLSGFDLVLSMGVLYHRREPSAHLRLLRELLHPDGELLLETLVLDEPGSRILRPAGRYAKMRNLYAIPTVTVLRQWLAEAGFARARLIDVTRTAVDEQRATPWMRFQSLADFLDPNDPTRTVEGHPAPCRAMLLAERG
jgi:tRNA (mo5U34)-methyltransferase